MRTLSECLSSLRYSTIGNIHQNGRPAESADPQLPKEWPKNNPKKKIFRLNIRAWLQWDSYIHPWLYYNKIHPTMTKRFLVWPKTECARREIRMPVCADGKDTGRSIPRWAFTLNLSSKAVSSETSTIYSGSGGNMYLAGVVGASHTFLCSLNSLDIFNRGMGGPQTKKKKNKNFELFASWPCWGSNPESFEFQSNAFPLGHTVDSLFID